MPKYGEGEKSASEDSPKWVKSKRRKREKKKERLKVGNNDGQLRIANATQAAAPARSMSMPLISLKCLTINVT